ncbi:ibr domain-containing protein [Colletotrichum incanum]|uniref:Ibr domain-containing protein n=1 Tax=Colletotrichum incanum TaxID=1573173 RepID=A0A167BGI4_COLIC|nr:ibr domain-containing protein [Colletotrichum incanum]OHW93040.1 hypothetical protein CSPAE12_08347 [Colletotrichum incanum]
MIGQRTISQQVQARHGHRINQHNVKDYKFVLDTCCWFDFALVVTALHIVFFVAFAVMAPPEGRYLEDWLGLVRGFRVMAVLFYELPFVFRKTQWISICHRHRLPSHATEFGSTMGMVQHLILIWAIEPMMIKLWRIHQLEEPLLGQSTGILLTTFVVVTAVVALRKLVARFALLADLAARLD